MIANQIGRRSFKNAVNCAIMHGVHFETIACSKENSYYRRHPGAGCMGHFGNPYRFGYRRI